MDNSFTRYPIEDRSYVSFIKKEIHTKAVLAKFSEIETGKIDIIVSEVTSNIIKHAARGELLYRVVHGGEVRPTFEMICIDKGPGIKDLANAMKDGNSTTNTIGGGMGSMERQSTLFQIMTMPGWGTALYSRVGPVHTAGGPSSFGIEVKSLLVPKLHEEVCGDGYAVVHRQSKTKILFGDGLGHGKFAAEAMAAAADFFLTCEDEEPVAILKQMHESVRRTRGLVATVVTFDRQAAEWQICGIGNISTRMYTGVEYRSYMAYNGTVGLNIPNSMKASFIPVEKNQHLIMCSDGITTRWQFNKFPYVFKYDPMLVAGSIYKDFARGSDDASVLIAKVN